MLEVKNLIKKYDDRTILDGISFRVSIGERIGLYGPSGCGKTTLLRIIAGLETPDSGEVIIDDVSMTESIPPYKRNLSMTFQEPTLWSFMKVRKNIEFGMLSRDSKRVDHIASRLEIESSLDSYPDRVSGGQAKRVALARALAADKDYILLDEPLSNIDRETKRTILNYLKEEVFTYKAVIYVSHDENELTDLGCRIIRI